MDEHPEQEPSAADVAEAVDGFFRAAEHGRADVLKALADHARAVRLPLAHVVDPASGCSPLHTAVARGNSDAVRVLLAAGFPPDHTSRPPDARSPYQLAQKLRATELLAAFHQFAVQQVAADDADAVRRLLRAGVRADEGDGSSGNNSLMHWAATCVAARALEVLLARDEVQQTRAMDRTNADGATPLHLASRANNAPCVRLLLRYGADPAVKGDAGAFKGRTALELATAPEVKELFAAAEQLKKQQQQQVENPELVAASLSPSSSPTASSPPSGRSTADGSSTGDITTLQAQKIESRRPSHSDREPQTARLMLQLEEKDLLVIQLRKTIEALVIEAQEIRKLGEERVVLDYVRKLREENTVLQRKLEDAEEHIRIQNGQLQQLKQEMRKMVKQQQGSAAPSDDLLNNDQSFSADGYASNSDAPGTRQLSASPLRLTSSSDLRRDERPPSSNSSESWNSVLGGLWPFNGSGEVQDIDGEVIMTV